MNRPEFNNLMSGNPAKWAQLNEELTPFINLAQQKGATKAEVSEAKSEIKKAQVDINPTERFRMDKFISEQRNLGTKERTIRRMVQRQWNITIL